MTIETLPYIATAPAPETAASEKTNSFLGLYFPTDLKNRVKDAAAAERRSMSQYMVMVVEKHFAAA
jgi:hypothetical protein